MKIWLHKSFEGHYPVGTGAVVIAPDRDSAKTYLDMFLAEACLPGCSADEFEEMEFSDGQVAILCDGNY